MFKFLPIKCKYILYSNKYVIKYTKYIDNSIDKSSKI